MVKDAAVRAELAAVRDDVLVLSTYLTQNKDFILSDFRRFGLEYFDLKDNFWSSEPVAPPPSRHQRDGARLAESPMFENLVDLLIAQYRNVSSGLDLLRDGMASAREAVEGRAKTEATRSQVWAGRS